MVNEPLLGPQTQILGLGVEAVNIAEGVEYMPAFLGKARCYLKERAWDEEKRQGTII